MDGIPDWMGRRTRDLLGPELPLYERATPVRVVPPVVAIGQSAGRGLATSVGYSVRCVDLVAATEVLQVIPTGAYNRLRVTTQPLAAPVGAVHLSIVLGLAPESRGSEGKFTVTPDVVAYAATQFPHWIEEGFQGVCTIDFALPYGDTPLYAYLASSNSAAQPGIHRMAVTMMTLV